jgi:serine/threonine protein kinase
MSKLLAQGGFGCIFHPGLKLDGSATTVRFATKLQKKTYTAENEIVIGEKLKTIKGYKNFFRIHRDYSSIHLSSIDDKLLKDCKPLNTKENIPYIALKLEYLEKPDFFEFLFDKNKTTKDQITIILESYMNILKGIKYLTEKKIVQFDLKNENILYDNKRDSFLISDFGISIDMDNYDDALLYKFFYTYAPEYYVWSFDIHILCLLLHNNEPSITVNHISDTATRFINANPAFSFFSDEFKSIYFEKCMLFGKQYIDRQGENVRDKKIKKLISGYKSWDNYGLSALYLRILSNYYNNKIPKSLFLIRFSQLLLQNFSPDPEERLSVKNTMTSFYDILRLDYSEENDLNSVTHSNYNYKKVIENSRKETEYLKTIAVKN